MNPQTKELIEAINELFIKIKPIYKADWSERWKRIQNAILVLETESVKEHLQKYIDYINGNRVSSNPQEGFAKVLETIIKHWSPK